MATTADKQLLDALNELITMDRAAAASYAAATKQIRDEAIASRIRAFGKDHERHVRDLGEMMKGMGGQVEEKPQIERKLARRAEEVRNITDMRELILGMRNNEHLTNEMYARCVDAAGVEGELKKLLERNYADEQRHLAWLQEQLDGMEGQGGGSSRASGSSGGNIDLNSASIDEISEIEGIGRRRAELLVDGRPFGSWDDVARIEGFDETLIGKLRARGRLG